MTSIFNAWQFKSKRLQKLQPKAFAKHHVTKSMLMMAASLPLLCVQAVSAQASGVSVSNYPLYLLSQEVTKGAAPAKQILQAGEVGHHGAISPSDIKTIQDSTFVVWFGESLETNLAPTLTKAPNSISLFKFRAFNRYPLRDVKGAPIKNTLDPHIWLDPQNAKAIAAALAAIHSHADPKNKALYQANLQKFAQKMNRAAGALNPPAKAAPYWAYHDAYHYLEPALNLSFAGSLSTDHHLAPTANQIKWLNDHRPKKQMCLIAQSAPNKGLLSKLQPVKATTQTEDMSGARDFVSGWQTMAKQILNCTV